MWHNVRLMKTISNICLGLAVLIAASAYCLWQIQRPIYALKTIKVRSANDQPLQHVNILTIQNTALPAIKGNFYTINLDDVKEAFEAVPWVRQASVKREWPNKLIVSIEEYEPLGVWGNDGQLLSTKGDVFTVNMAEAEEDYNLLTFMGPQNSEQLVLQKYIAFSDQFAQLGLKPRSILLSDRYAWSVVLDNDVRVEFGSEKQEGALDALMKRLQEAYPKLAEKWPDGLLAIDLRYQNGLAVELKNSATKDPKNNL